MYSNDNRNYIQRLVLSGLIALSIHLSVGLLLSWGMKTVPRMSLAPYQKPNPLRVDLVKSLEPKHLVDVVQPSDDVLVKDTDLIATQDSRASDFEITEGSEHVPYTEKRDTYDELGGEFLETLEKESPSKNLREKKQHAFSSNPKQKVDQNSVHHVAAIEVPEKLVPLKESNSLIENQPIPSELPDKSSEVPIKKGISRARLQGGAKETGILSFEAHRHIMAPYLQAIREKVENRWKAILQTRYSGTASTQAVIECAIGPDGNLVYVRIVEPGDSPTYAYLCKEAIERSAPFGPFPLEIPSYFRSQNIEIRWTFSFFM